MIISFPCPNCKRTVDYDGPAGAKIVCDFCSQRMKLPDPPAATNKTVLVQPEEYPLQVERPPPAAVTTAFGCPRCRVQLTAEPGALVACPACGQQIQMPPAAAPFSREPREPQPQVVVHVGNQGSGLMIGCLAAIGLVVVVIIILSLIANLSQPHRY